MRWLKFFGFGTIRREVLAGMPVPHDPYILILGGSHDGQLIGVREALNGDGIRVRLIDHIDPQPFELSVDRSGRYRLEIDGEEMPEPPLVWCRLKIHTILSEWTEATIPEFVRRIEWRKLLSGIAHLYDDRCIHSISALWAAEHKPRQFSEAVKAGFEIPETSFFAGKSYAKGFASRHDPCLAKVIAARNVPRLNAGPDSYRILQTMDLGMDTIDASDEDEFLSTPAMFQEWLTEGWEYRVIAFRDRAFVYRRLDMVQNRTRPDPRILLGAQYEMVPTDPAIRDAASRYLQAMGLHYGTFDLIEPSDGSLYFLECNPEGQWSAAVGHNPAEVAAHFASVLGRLLTHRVAAA
ncbi:hypothetical protein RMQ97_07940 [Maricaulis sp. D1M11]|uniref:hypothetical protein n=1 Tax=Maricaulis sp. D1M11 TaxID=3076117 RepID=UPI0039B62583